MAVWHMKLEFKDDHLILATAADAMIRLIAAGGSISSPKHATGHRTAPTASAALGGH